MTPTRTALVVLLLTAAGACRPAGPALRVEDAWSRPATAALPGVVYLTIANDGRQPDRLVGARSGRCGKLEIHHTIVEDGRMSMAPVTQDLVIEPGASLAFEPGGYHLMLFDLGQPLRSGEHFTLTLAFEHSGEIPVEVEVR